MQRGVAILGSTGSIGTTALRVIGRHPDRFRVAALTAFENAELLREQAKEVGASYVGLVGDASECDSRWRKGTGCLIEAATHEEVDIVLNAVVGAVGLEATLAALHAGKRVALANKESLVMGGDLVIRARDESAGDIVPVDSEHSAILQCLGTRPMSEVHRVVLTASGGPFRGWSAERIGDATVADALNHPTWRMGRKITIDSATLANKALEVIEAHYLFGLPYDRIQVVVHPQSVVHSFVEFVDGSVLAQVGVPSMELPVLYALTHPARITDEGIPRFEVTACGSLTFEAVDEERFPALRLGIEAGEAGGSAPAVFNAANEAAVALFLEGRMTFGDIAAAIRSALGTHQGWDGTSPSLSDVIAADAGARQHVRSLFG